LWLFAFARCASILNWRKPSTERMLRGSMTSLSPPLQAVVALFRGPLQTVRFADIDAVGLSNLAAEAESAASEVEAQEAKLTQLRQALVQKQEALLGLAQQALAYARIYAEGDEALTAELNDIALPRATKPRKAAAKPLLGRDSAEPAAETAPQSEAPTEESSSTAAAEAANSDESSEPAGEPGAAKPGRRKVQRRLGRAADRGDTA
jgi:hypothetical protein